MRVTPACSPSPELALRMVGDPVDVVTGACFDSVRDAIVDSPVPMEWRRYHDSRRTEDRGLGPGWRHSFDHRLIFDLDGIRYEAPSGDEIKFPFFDEGSRLARRGYILAREADTFRLQSANGPTLTFRRVPRAGTRLERIGAGLEAVVVDYSPFDGSLVGYTDCENNRIVLVHEQGHIRSVRLQAHTGEPPTDLVRYTYDRGYLVDAEDAYRHHLRYAYDGEGRIVRRTDRLGYSFLFEFDSEGRCVKSSGEDGLFAVALRYFPLQGLTEVAQADGTIWKYAYDVSGTITSIIDGAGGTRTFSVRKEDGQVELEIDPAGNEIRYEYTNEGRLLGKRDALGRWVLENKIPYRIPTRPIEYEWGYFGTGDFELPVKHLEQPGPLSGVDPSFSGAMAPTTLRNNLSDEVYGSLHFARDAGRGRTIQVRDAQGLLIREERDGRTRRYGYDPNGNQAWTIDFDGGKTEHKIASLNQFVETRDPNGNTTRLAYARDDELCAVADPLGTVTEFWRDGHSHITKVRRANVEKETYIRDSAGRLLEKHDANGRVLYTVKCGPQGEVLERTFAGGGFERYEYDEVLKIVRAECQHGTVELGHTADGLRTRDERDAVGVQALYDGRDPLEVRTLGFVTRYTHSHNSHTHETAITDPTGRVHRFRRLGHGVFQRTFANGFSETIQYHPDGHCLAKIAQSTGSPQGRWERQYEYSGEGDLVRTADSSRGTTRYEYDAAHRLVAERHANGSSRRFEHDAAGNLLQNGLSSASYWQGNFLGEANGRRFEHDSRHAISLETWSGGCRRFNRDARDQLTGVEYFNLVGGGAARYESAGTWTAKYDALNRRIEKTFAGNTTTFYWDRERLAAEVLPSGQVRIYIYADALAMTPVLFVDYENTNACPESGKVYVVFSTHLGCPEAVQDMDGTFVWRARIDPYGLVHVEVGADFHQPIRWPGHYFDTEIGLQYNRFRTYSPELGRYLEPDPLGREGGLENVYQYAPNPLSRVDIQGTHVCPRTGKPVDDDGDSTKRDTEGDAQQQALRRTANDPVDIRSSAGKLMGRFSFGNSLEIISKKDTLHGGNTIHLDREKTTTLTGILRDVGTVARRGAEVPGATRMGENPGAINILRSPEWGVIQEKHKPILATGDENRYWRTVTNEFWETVNKPWLDEAIARGDNIRFVSDPAADESRFVMNGNKFVLDENGERVPTIFSRELDYLKSKGYIIQEDGTAVKP